MADKTGIEWCDATWNPTVGCSIVSPGCTNCCAMRTAHRQGGGGKYAGLTQVVNGNPVWTGEVRLHEPALNQPLRWRRPRRIFVNSMSDLFHEDLPDEAIDAVFGVMSQARHHTFQILTKRPARMRAWYERVWHARKDNAQPAIVPSIAGHRRAFGPYKFNDETDWHGWPLPNVWLGVSVEDQARADERIPELLATPAALRFCSAEPLLGPVDLTQIEAGVHDTFSDCGGCPDPFYPLESVGWGRTDALRGEYCGTMRSPDGRIWVEHEQVDFRMEALDWLICGGESGPGARPMHPDWARSLRDQCQTAGVPFFFKQWGEWAPTTEDQRALGAVPAWRVGKARAGRLLDGREWNEFPCGGSTTSNAPGYPPRDAGADPAPRST